MLWLQQKLWLPHKLQLQKSGENGTKQEARGVG
jgi:hypothetical protein